MMMGVPMSVPVLLRVVFTVHTPICPLLLQLGLFLCLDLRIDGRSFSWLMPVHSRLWV